MNKKHLNESYNSKTIKDILTNNIQLKYLNGEYKADTFDYRSNIIKYQNSTNIMDKIVNTFTSLYPLYESLLPKEFTRKLTQDIKYNLIDKDNDITKIYIEALENKQFNKNLSEEQVYLLVHKINQIFKQLTTLITNLYKGNFTFTLDRQSSIKILQNIKDEDITPIYKDEIQVKSFSQKLYNNIAKNNHMLMLTYDNNWELYKPYINNEDITKLYIKGDLKTIKNKIKELYNLWLKHNDYIKYIQYKNISIPYLDNKYDYKLTEAIGLVILYMFQFFDEELNFNTFYNNLLNIYTQDDIIGYDIRLPNTYSLHYFHKKDPTKSLWSDNTDITMREIVKRTNIIYYKLSNIMDNGDTLSKDVNKLYRVLRNSIDTLTDNIEYPVYYEPNNINQMLLFTRYEQYLKNEVYNTLKDLLKYLNINKTNTDKAEKFINIINNYIQRNKEYFEKIKDVTDIQYFKK